MDGLKHVDWSFFWCFFLLLLFSLWSRPKFYIFFFFNFFFLLLHFFNIFGILFVALFFFFAGVFILQSLLHNLLCFVLLLHAPIVFVRHCLHHLVLFSHHFRLRLQSLREVLLLVRRTHCRLVAPLDGIQWLQLLIHRDIFLTKNLIRLNHFLNLAHLFVRNLPPCLAQSPCLWPFDVLSDHRLLVGFLLELH